MIQFTNPWGISDGLEAQRSDLWSLDLRPVIALVQYPEGVTTTPEYDELVRSISLGFDANSYTRKITLPDAAISALRVIKGTQYLNMPGYDEPLTSTRVDFWHEATGSERNIGPQKSGIYSLLACWHMLAMAGQTRFNRTQLLLNSSTAKPSYSCDLTLTMLTGSDAGDTLDNGASYFLQGCWISDLQLSDLDYSGGDLFGITATLQIGSIAPNG